MDYYWSPTTHGIYLQSAHGASIPEDARKISDAERLALLAGERAGKVIDADGDGNPTLVDPPSDSAEDIWRLIKVERDRRISGGFKCSDHWYHSDAVSKTQHLANKDTARDQIAAGGTMADALLDPSSGNQIRWKAMSGEFVPLTCQLAFDIVAAAKSAELATYLVAEQHKAAMEASGDPASYDYSSGWPEIYADQ